MDNIKNQLHQFVPRRHYGDLIWEFYFRNKSRWEYLNAKEYDGNLYFFGSHIDAISTDSNERSGDEDKAREFLKRLPKELNHIYKEVKINPLKYHLRLNQSVSKALRQGVIARSLVNELIPNYSYFNEDLGQSKIRRMIQLLGQHSDPLLDEMTAQKYFDYCKVAYLANGKKSHEKIDLSASGFDLYERWADNRDEGLKKIDRNSPQAFERWYRNRKGIGHPFEIYRGGNSTHIDLSVIRDSQKKWKILLSAFSSSRLAETCRIALAFHKAGLAFELDHKQSVLLRLTEKDTIGVVPERYGIKYAWHDFPKEFNVSDCIHFSWFKPDEGKSVRPMREIQRLVSWFPLPSVELA